MTEAERKLGQMQALYEQLDAELHHLQALNQRLPEIRTQLARLRELYQCDWLESVDALKSDQTAWERVNQMPHNGYYSVLGEDTIWNTLEGLEQETKHLLHQLIDLLP